MTYGRNYPFPGKKTIVKVSGHVVAEPKAASGPQAALHPPLGGGVRDLKSAGQHKRLFENYFAHYVREFDEVLVLSFFDERIEEYRDARVPARVKILPNRHRLHRYLYSWLAPRLHSKELEGVRVIRVSQTTGSLPAWFLKRRLKAPVFMTYGYDYVLFAKVRGRLATWLARLHERIGRAVADYWITTTPELVTHLQDRHRVDRDRIFLIPNGVDLSVFNGATAPGEDDDLRSLVFVGRLEAQKNLKFLLDCASRAADRLATQLKLTIVGDGSLRAELARHPVSRLLKLELTGMLEQSRLPALFESSQLFVTASLYEGHPKAILEAMGAGLPVLGLDAPGVTPLLRSSGQFVYSDLDGFVDCFRKLNEAPVRVEASKRARARVQRDFDLEKNLLVETELLSKAARKESSP